MFHSINDHINTTASTPTKHLYSAGGCINSHMIPTVLNLDLPRLEPAFDCQTTLCYRLQMWFHSFFLLVLCDHNRSFMVCDGPLPFVRSLVASCPWAFLSPILLALALVLLVSSTPSRTIWVSFCLDLHGSPLGWLCSNGSCSFSSLFCLQT